MTVAEKHEHYIGLSIDKVTDDIKNKLKNMIAANCKPLKMKALITFEYILI